MHAHKYFQNFSKFIGPDIAISSVFTGQLAKTELMAILDPINFKQF
jgi:hypothetical protein